MSISTIFLIIFITIFIPIGIAGSYILIRSFYLKKYSSYFDELESFLTSEPYIETLTILRTVDNVLNEQEKNIIEKVTSLPNDEIKQSEKQIAEINENKEIFGKKYITIEDEIRKLNEYKQQMFDNLSVSAIFSCRSIYKKIELEKKRTEKICQEIQEETKKFINPIKTFENEKFKYDMLFRKISKWIDQWNGDIMSDQFKTNLDVKINNISNYSEKATKCAQANDNAQVLKWFTLYKKQLYDLLIFDNYYKRFKEILIVKSNDVFSKMWEYVDNVKNNVGSNLDNLNIKEIIDAVEKEYAQAKESFYKLDISATQQYIERYHTSLLMLSYQLTSELSAFQYFERTNTNEKLKKFYFLASDRQKEILEQTNRLSSVDKIFYWNMIKEVQNVKDMFNNVIKSINEFKDSLSSKEISNISKLDNYKNIIFQFELIFSECSNIEKNIEMFYNEGASQGARYYRLKKIYICALADVKNFNINLTIEDKEIISKINKLKLIIDNEVSLQSNNYSEKETKKLVDDFYNLIVKFLLKVQKKVVILKTFSLINTEYSYKRIENNYFNKRVIESESLIKEGKYFEGIEVLINGVKGVLN